MVSFEASAVVMMIMTDGSMSLNLGIASIPLRPGI